MSLLLDVAIFLRANSKAIKLTSTQKVILFMIASRIGRNKDCWIKQYELAADCQITDRQLRTDLKFLSEQNLLIIEKIVTKKGKQDKYQLNTDIIDYRKWASASVEQTTGSELPVVPPPTGSGLPEGCGSGLPVPPLENVVQLFENEREKMKIPIVKETIENNNKANKQISTDRCARFDEFWKLYPRKVAPKVAKKKWASMKCDDMADEIISHVKLRNATEWAMKEIKFIPHPTTFLNQERWKDEVETATHEKNRPANELNRRAASVKRVMDNIWH